jgi:hypothetical protein
LLFFPTQSYWKQLCRVCFSPFFPVFRILKMFVMLLRGNNSVDSCKYVFDQQKDKYGKTEGRKTKGNTTLPWRVNCKFFPGFSIRSIHGLKYGQRRAII